MENIKEIKLTQPMPQQYSKVILFCRAALICIGSSVVAQQLYVMFRHGYGLGDTRVFVFWLTPLALLTGLVAFGLSFFRVKPMIHHIVSAFIGLVIGFLWTWTVAILLGPWFGMISFPVLYFWMFGSFLSLLSSSFYVFK